jgi:hypothetical protein
MPQSDIIKSYYIMESPSGESNYSVFKEIILDSSRKVEMIMKLDWTKYIRFAKTEEES